MKFLIENKNNVESKVIMFGYNRYLLTPNYGSDIGVDILVLKTFEPKSEIKEEYFTTLGRSMEEPFRIKTIQFDCNGDSYVKEIAVNYYTEDANGRPYDQDYCFDTNKKHKTDLLIDANSEISFYIKPKQIIHVLIDE